jgi:hypothetical protein
VKSAQSSGARVVLLGASNLAAGLRDAADAARSRLGAPLEIFAAAGRGRSYGQVSRFLGRVLPGIDACGLWRALEAAPAAPTYALVTDLGNDLAFGASAAQVQGWLELALDRLAKHDAQIAVTGLPLEAVERMPPAAFRFWAKLLFPWHSIERGRLLEQARELETRLAKLASERGLAKVDPQLAWYGRDPIHVRSARRAEAWRSYVSPWSDAAAVAPSTRTRFQGWPWYEQVRLFGWECGTAQPCARFAGPSSLALF